MKSSSHVGVCFCKDRIQLAEVEHGKKMTVTSLAESNSPLDFTSAGSQLSADHPQISSVVAELQGLLKRNKIAAKQISFALPTSSLFINIIPVDLSLQGPTLKEYLQWELAQYYPESASNEFATDSHPLPTNEPNAKRFYMVAVRRGAVGFLQKVAAGLQLKLQIVDIDHFSTEKTLASNYPEVANQTVALFGVRDNGVDASVVQNAQMVDFRSLMASSLEDAKKAIVEYLKSVKRNDSANSPSQIFLYGMNVPPDFLTSLKTETGLQVSLLDALRKLAAGSALSKPMLKESHRFAAAVGLALRTS